MNKRARWQRYMMGLMIGGVVSMAMVLIMHHALPRTTLVSAQDSDELGLEISKELVGGADVQVGQVLEFVIRIRNTGTLSITHIVVVDQFDAAVVEPAQVGQFAEPNDPPLSDPPGTLVGNTITWDDVVEQLPTHALDSGDTMELHVYLRAIHPSETLQTVNYAEIKEAIAWGGNKRSDIGSDEYEDEVGGSHFVLSKELTPNEPIFAGMPVTFTITIKNDGTAPIDSIPLLDFYNPAIMRFVYAVPPPSTSDTANGSLEWVDLMASVGREMLAPGESIEIITVYEALQSVDGTINEAEVNGSSDKYGNVLTPRNADVPIRILPAPTQTPASATATPTQTPTAVNVITNTATAMTTPVPTLVATNRPTLPVTATATATPQLIYPTFVSANDKTSQDDSNNDDDNNTDNTTTVVVNDTPTAVAATTDATAVAATTDATTIIIATTIAVVDTATITITATPTTPIIGNTATPLMPGELPRTGSGSGMGHIGVWALVGIALIIFGGMLLQWSNARKS